MKSTNLCLSIIFLVFLTNTAIAEKELSNSVKFSYSHFAFPGLNYNIDEPIIADQIGLYYERSVYKNWGVGFGYAMFNTLFTIDGVESKFGPGVSEPLSENSVNGSLLYRHKYKMVDLFISYKLFPSKKHKVSLAIGPSYTWGKNVYRDSVEVWGVEKNADHFGIAPAVSYDYCFWANRLNIGADIKCRKYFGLSSEQIDYGLHFGLNF